MRGLQAPNLQQLEAYNVNVEGQPEVIWQPLYDFQTYPAAGFTSLQFFAVPQGQGGKTFDDTNMELASALPVPINMAITSIEVIFFPGNAINAAGTAANLSGASNWNDAQAVHEAGHLSCVIGSKEYVLDAPLGRFPQSFRLAGGAAVASETTAGVGQQIDYAVFAGAIYNIVPLRLISQQNFRVDLVFSNGAVALPSTVDGRIGVQLNGFRYRLAQ